MPASNTLIFYCSRWIYKIRIVSMQHGCPTPNDTDQKKCVLYHRQCEYNEKRINIKKVFCPNYDEANIVYFTFQTFVTCFLALNIYDLSIILT